MKDVKNNDKENVNMNKNNKDNCDMNDNKEKCNMNKNSECSLDGL